MAGGLRTIAALHAWSVTHPDLFWSLVWDICDVIGDKGERLVADRGKMPGAQFLPDATLNFAENLLAPDRRWRSDRLSRRGQGANRLTCAELNALVSRMQQALRAAGVGVGDRVAAMLPNGPDAVALILATTSIGAIWSSCSPDFGERGVLDRFGQIEPKVFIAVDGYWYNGKPIRLLDKLRPIVAQLPSAQAIVIADYLGEAEAVARELPRATSLAALLKPFTPQPLIYERLPFDHPIYILFSSGTTGVPKCIVHGAGGTLLQHLKEHRLQCDLRRGRAAVLLHHAAVG